MVSDPSSQQDSLDSGLWCLVAVAAFHQIPADYQQLRHQFGVGDTPLSDTDLQRAAKALGLRHRFTPPNHKYVKKSIN